LPGQETRHSFKTKAICDLIKVSQLCGVSRLKIGDLEVRFFPDSSRHEESTDEFIPDIAESAEMDAAPDQVGKGLPAKVPQDLLQDFVESQTLIDDHLAYETMMIDRHQGHSAGHDEAT
jgi:hypothetical protein